MVKARERERCPKFRKAVCRSSLCGDRIKKTRSNLTERCTRVLTAIISARSCGHRTGSNVVSGELSPAGQPPGTGAGRAVTWHIGGRRELVGALGSSVLLDPEVKVDPDKNEIIWTFVTSHKSPVTILHHIPDYMKWAEPSEQFKSRLQFIPSNGSLIVNRLEAGDQGAYSFTVDQRELEIIQLLLFDTLMKALILTNSSSIDSTIRLTCNVSGDPHEYQWWKDGGEVSRLHQLIDGNRTLVILKASRYDCGIYTCVATNPVSSIQADYTLIIAGFPPEDVAVITLSIIELVISSAFLIAFVFLHCLKLEGWKAVKNHNYWLLGLLLCNMVSLAAIFIALIFRIGIEDIWKWTVFGLHVIVIIISITFLMLMSDPNYRGCDSSFITWRVFFVTMIWCAVTLLLYFVVHWGRKKETSQATPCEVEQNIEESQPL
ncbi:uncharacterized protein LOC127585773 isoform X2 [Pristis pectinata]|uniref:uncharacterized protein LOC127585773 isoform X2 n=1 Tax=Pristis pectinata TaxID=685728 RepID=UPI00223CB0C9|nr:uncharacterized protein LOC127585773 isoform X2 [Pristis pectinata]